MMKEERGGDTDARPPRGGFKNQEVIPARYNERTELTCEVPPGGKNDVNFALKSP
jgi:hypothetical protein